MKTDKTYLLVFVCLAAAFLLRIIPHIPNFLPLLALGIFISRRLTPTKVLVAILGGFVLSDIAMSLLTSNPLFGDWTLFTYSGIAAVILINAQFKQQSLIPLIFATSFSVIGYWLWTNFGTWLLSGLYPLTATGLWSCYIAALPFLRNAFLAEIAGIILLFLIVYLTKQTDKVQACAISK